MAHFCIVLCHYYIAIILIIFCRAYLWYS